MATAGCCVVCLFLLLNVGEFCDPCSGKGQWLTGHRALSSPWQLRGDLLFVAERRACVCVRERDRDRETDRQCVCVCVCVCVCEKGEEEEENWSGGNIFFSRVNIFVLTFISVSLPPPCYRSST